MYEYYGIFVQSQLNNGALNVPMRQSRQCDIRHTDRCFVSLLANLEGEIIREPANEHTLEPDFNRYQKFQLKRKLVERARDHIEEPPVKIIGELVIPESSSVLPSKSNLK